VSRQLKQGQGWRLGWQPQPQVEIPFSALVGGEDWALELTEGEWQDFRRLFLELAAMVEQIATELMPEETITCESRSDLVWMEVCGYPKSFEVSFILLTGRRGEGHWPAPVVPELIRVMQVLQGF
jgi:hypothetical protein